MNRTFARTLWTVACLSAFAGSSRAIADDQTPSRPLTASEQQALKSEAAGARQARAAQTPSQKRNATLAKQQQAQQSSRYGENEIRALDVTPEEAARLRERKAATREARGAQTATDKKASRSQKQRDLEETARSAPGG
jgi:hypothetical protein